MGEAGGRRAASLAARAEDLRGLRLPELQALLDAEKAYNRLLPAADTIQTFFSNLSEPDARLFAEVLKSRLQSETDVLGRYLDLGLDPFAADLCTLALPFPVSVVGADGDNEPALGDANACFIDGAILLAAHPPSLGERLAQYATRGVLGNDLFHEVFHGLQRGVEQYQSLADVMSTLTETDCGDAKVLLAEAHAWLCSLPGFKHDLVATMLSVSYRFERVVLAYAIDLLFSLSVLGLDDTEVAALVGTAVWSVDDGNFSELERERDRLRVERGLSPEELAAEVERRQLVDRVQAVRGVGIARELVEAMRLSPRHSGDAVTA